ncbi:hypothetical protein RCO28_33115 [Streptomyces sp. LHD-70]|uniref:hypothetical protein n=1 Tax=Streptomyces sp. LHD-70 TaxID=3072140 RepID=UPI00280CFF19|nr:hypothetical protein [Streptomyces sp. LHD-70]MDQ8707274.1 hypothetical protein [Streptomyces sp. LHD-70]
MTRATAPERGADKPARHTALGRRRHSVPSCWRDGELMGAVLLFVLWFSLITFVFAVVSQELPAH